MLIQFNQIDISEYFDNYMDLKEELEKILRRSVDLVENQAIKNSIFRKILDREKQLIINEEVLKCLYDIRNAIEEIDWFIVNRERRFDVYSQDIILKRAIERNLEIIGEVMNRILKEEPGFSIKNILRIIGLRNKIIHG